MAKKKPVENSNPFRLQREIYEQRLRQREDEANHVSSPKVNEVCLPHKIPGREIVVDEKKLTLERRRLIDQCLQSQIKWPVYVFGEVGVGKTFLAAAVYQNWPSPSPLWMPYTQFCDRCERIRDGRGICVPKNSFESRDITSFEEWWRYLSTFSLIVIDDFGILDDLEIGRLSGDLLQSRRFRMEWMIELMDQRQGKPLFLTGNLAVENMDFYSRLRSMHEVFDLRLIDRFKAGRPIHISGKDLRTEDYTMVSIE